MTSTFSSCLIVILSIAIMLLKKNSTFKHFLAGKLQKSLSKLNRHIPVSSNFQLGQSEFFRDSVGLVEVYDALLQLQEYGVRAVRQNSTVFHLANTLSPAHYEQLRALNYFEKLESVNEAISQNQKAAQSIVENALSKLLQRNALDNSNGPEVESISKGLGYEHQGKGVLSKHKVHKINLSPTSNQSRVNEALSHMCRDWHPAYKLEREPLTDFMLARVRKLKLQGRTLVVIPGSGAGGIAYEVAKAFPNFDVHSIELSTLMYLCNEFALDSNDHISIKPFAQHFSGQLNIKEQVRAFNMNLAEIKRPENLSVHLGNFCDFSPCDKYDQIIVFTAYFIDTAENLLSYFDSIERMQSFCSKLHWINAGPLKYGTRPKVQLTDSELTKLRELRHWKDLSHACNPKELNGYLTNQKSLYQGYYSLVKFHSVYEGT